MALGPSVPAAQDLDMDGLPDWWELAKGLSVFDDGSNPTSRQNGPSGDPDENGISNLEEYVIGLDPNWPNLNSNPELDFRINAEDRVQLNFFSIPDRLYRLWWSRDLEVWSPLGPVIDTGADVLPARYEITDHELPDTVERYYRLEVSLP